MAKRIEEIILARRQKLQRLHDLGLAAFPSVAIKDNDNKEVVENFPAYENKILNLSGRLMSFREHGKVTFGHIQDQSGKIQLFIRSDNLAETSKHDQTIGFADLNLLDMGDFVQAEGLVVKTRTGEVSLAVTKIKLLTKSLRPLPEKWKGMTNKELAFRRRYLDILMNQDKKDRFIRKSNFWKVIREYLNQRSFMEVETPVLESITGGADAKPFKTHMHSLDQDYFLRISTELFQKRLIGAGYEKVYTIGPNFRNEGMDDEHLPEYYQCEWYWAYVDYRKNMELVRDLFREIAVKVYGKTRFTSRGMEYDLADDWKEIDYSESIKKKLGIDIFVDSEEKMLGVIKKEGVTLSGAINRQRLIDNMWKIVRKEIAGPAFLVNVPKFMSPLAKNKAENVLLTERFQPIIAGSELGNGYSELNDPDEQRERFMEQQAARDAGDEEAQMMDVDFVEMLEYGMPPTSGFGMSERLFWFLEDVSGREGTLFPPLKPKKKLKKT